MNIYDLNRYELMNKCNEILKKLHKEKELFEKRVTDDYANNYKILWFKCTRKKPLNYDEAYTELSKPVDYWSNTFSFLNGNLYWRISTVNRLIEQIELAISISGDVKLENAEIDFINSELDM